ncbi:Aste57867_19051 [Aphanomyces stellatus]|uniref:N-acetylgalactosaminide beta-1,3-galactosyltransferase n=1 Tax=Aphanomyces stellatus TaxID=120398 RepID=A0A485LCG7_9STRA|nr:hypothetical protein As57867_018987 [Aphanomyces stellatus]VFT95776.1 Aste57867_19051 [Aphanomyces stellatus]
MGGRSGLLDGWLVAGLCRVWYMAGFFDVQGTALVAQRKELRVSPETMTFIVYSSMWEEGNYPARMEAIQNTWASHLPHWFAVQTKTPQYHFTPRKSKSVTLLVPPAREMETPIKYALETVYNDQHKYNWIYLAADSSYVIPSNLVHLVQGLDPDEAHYLGHPLLLPTSGPYSWAKLDNLIFNSMAGILMSRGAVDKLLEGMRRGCKSRCEGCGEDLTLAFCLREQGVEAMDTRDPVNHRQTFHIFQPGSLVGNQRVNGSFDYTPENCEWFQLYSMWPIQMNLDCCGAYTTMFQYTNADEIYAIHSMLMDVKPYATSPDVTDKQLIDLILEHGKELDLLFPSYVHPTYWKVRKLLLQQVHLFRMDQLRTADDDATVRQVRPLSDAAKTHVGGQNGVVLHKADG